jgi:hypothetical protein
MMLHLGKNNMMSINIRYNPLLNNNPLTHAMRTSYAACMIIRRIFPPIFCLFTLQSLCETHIRNRFVQNGYVEIYDTNHGTAAFDTLYAHFDTFITFLHTNPTWAQKLYAAKERFIRSPERNFYATDFFGFYDESAIAGRNQISFYYSIHFHAFICTYYPELNTVPEITRFLEACLEIQKPYGDVFTQAAADLGLGTIFSSAYANPPLLLKVIKYLPAYQAMRAHYDGTAFSLFLDSTDNEALLLSPYKASFTVDDFVTPFRAFSRDHQQHSILLIPGTLLAECAIYPTPHIVIDRGTIRYATVAFAMRPHYTPPKNTFPPLPNFKH